MSLSIVEDDPQRMTAPRPQPADSMAQIHTIRSAGSLHRTMMHRKRKRIALSKRNHLRPRLHTRTLLRQHKLASNKILSRLREQNRHLYREDMFPIKILMQTVVIPFPILQQQRSRPDLTRIMASLDEVGMHLRITDIHSHRQIPTIGNRRKSRIKCVTQPFDNIRQRIIEVLVLPASKTVPPHYDTASNVVILRIECSQSPTLFPRKHAFEHCIPLSIKIL